VVGGFGAADSDGTSMAKSSTVRELSADDAAIQLAYASTVVIVPGYGLAAAQAQHALQELAGLLQSRGIEVGFAVHPVAGRMPGHMNVLLAEANVSYERMLDLDQANRVFPRTDVVLVVGANDIINPAARRAGTAISGMPILDVDQARSVIVIKRSMGHGYAGIENQLYSDPKTGMVFADAKAGLTAITSSVTTLVG
jgi:H+-translocating NAD(P) transhydrogenase subunit beta